MTSQLAQFWSDLLTKRTAVRKRESLRQRRSLETGILKYLRRVHPKIYSGMSDARFTLTDSDKLLKQLKRSSNTMESIIALRFLIKGLEAGKNTLEWPNVVVPVMPILASREPARFTPQTFRSLNAIQSVHTSFAIYLESPPENNPSRHLGTILLSAVLYGGLLSANWLTPLLRGLPDRVMMSGELFWLELQRPYVYPKFAEQQEKRKNVNRRWFPDPLTQALILRLHTNFRHLLAACSRLDALTCLKSALHLVSGTDDPLSTTTLYRGANCYLAMRSPGFLVNYASGKTHSASLPIHVWSRFITGKANKIIDAQNEENLLELPEEDSYELSQGPYDLHKQEQLRLKLSSILGDSRRNHLKCTNTRFIVEAFFDANSHKMVPALQMLCGWAIELLTRLPDLVAGRKLKTALQPSSIATYLQSIDRELISCAGTDDISKYDPNELRDLYFDTLKAFKIESQLSKPSSILTQFHQFLVRKYRAPKIDLDGLVQKKGPPELGVDANIISPSMFRLALYSLGWELPTRSRIQTIRCLIGILGFRCGLRHSEALCLRIGDLMGELYPEIFIRTNHLFRTKTPDSTRRIPVYLLLEKEELEELRCWQQLRKAEEGAGDYLCAPLFGAPGQNSIHLENEIFTPLIQVLRQVTGDPTIVFHHLRHSFASRLLLILLAERMPDAFVRESLADYCHFHRPTKELISGLFGNMNQGRQFLYGISNLMGHAGVNTTLLAYLHVCDWLLGLIVHDPIVQPSLSAAAIMQITGLKRAMVFRIKSDSKQSNWQMGSYLEVLARHGNKIFPDALVDMTTDITAPSPQLEESASSLPNWPVLEHALKLRQEQCMSFEDIGNRLRLLPETIEMWCSAALRIRDMTTNDGTLQHLTAWQRHKTVNQAGNSKLFPTPSDYPMDQIIVKKILKKIKTLSDAELDEIRSGCQLFVQRYSSNQGFVRFTDIAGAADFRKFLKLAGVPDDMVYVTMFTKTSPPSPEEVSKQRQITEAIGIEPDHVVSKGKRHVKYRRTHECSVGFIVARSDRTIKRKDKEVHIEALYGFRYAMYLLVIGLGERDDQPTLLPY